MTRSGADIVRRVAGRRIRGGIVLGLIVGYQSRVDDPFGDEGLVQVPHSRNADVEVVPITFQGGDLVAEQSGQVRGDFISCERIAAPAFSGVSERRCGSAVDRRAK